MAIETGRSRRGLGDAPDSSASTAATVAATRSSWRESRPERARAPWSPRCSSPGRCRSIRRLEEEEAAEAEPLFEEAREKLGGLEVETRAYGGGSPAAILTKLAEQEDFDLIVVGSPHRGPIGRVLLGSVAEASSTARPATSSSPRRATPSERPRLPGHRRRLRRHPGSQGRPAAGRSAGAPLQRHDQAPHRRHAAGRRSRARSAIPRRRFRPSPDKVINEALDSVDPKLAAEGRRLDGSTRPRSIARECEEGVDLWSGSRGYGPVARVLLGSVSRQLIPGGPLSGACRAAAMIRRLEEAVRRLRAARPRATSTSPAARARTSAS